MQEFFTNLWVSVHGEDLAKARAKRAAAEVAATEILGPRPAPPPPPPDPLRLLEKELQAIDEAGLRDEARAREQYLELLARLAPARTGAAPPPDAHALAVPPSDGPPAPEEVIAALKEAKKTREALRQDLVVFTRLREQADLAATLPALKAAEKEADAALAAVKAAFEAVEAEWAGKIEVQRRLQTEAVHARYRCEEAVTALKRTQGINDYLVRPRLRDRATPEEQAAAEAAAREDVAARQEKALRLGALEAVFFPPPPPPPPDTTTRYESCSWVYYPRDGQS